MKGKPFWTKDRNAVLTKLWNRGELSRQQIAERMGCSVSAISMQTWRLGLTDKAKRKGGTR